MGDEQKRLSVGKMLLGEVSICYDTTVYTESNNTAKKEFSKKKKKSSTVL